MFPRQFELHTSYYEAGKHISVLQLIIHVCASKIRHKYREYLFILIYLHLILNIFITGTNKISESLFILVRVRLSFAESDGIMQWNKSDDNLITVLLLETFGSTNDILGCMIINNQTKIWIEIRQRLLWME